MKILQLFPLAFLKNKSNCPIFLKHFEIKSLVIYLQKLGLYYDGVYETFCNLNLIVPIIYLWNKVFCFVLSCWDLPNHKDLCCALRIFEKLSMNRVHQLGLGVFGTMMCKMLIIEPFSQWKLKKLKLKFVLEFRGVLGVVGKLSAS